MGKIELSRFIYHIDYYEAAKLVWKRKARFVECYNPIDNVTDNIKKVFSDYDKTI